MSVEKTHEEYLAEQLAKIRPRHERRRPVPIIEWAMYSVLVVCIGCLVFIVVKVALR
jgi:hypothetical protein